MTGSDGKAWLIDPAVYVGHAEADLAMTELFGGFPQVFYDAYREAAPMRPGYGRRRDLYNLYPRGITFRFRPVHSGQLAREYFPVIFYAPFSFYPFHKQKSAKKAV